MYGLSRIIIIIIIYILYNWPIAHIIIRKFIMCGDSEVPEISYDFYMANEDYILTIEKLKKF